jgi:mannose-6-phosphate isomerase-like protein (cupin superfamily)
MNQHVTTRAAGPLHAACGSRPDLAVFDVRIRVLMTAAETGGALALFEEITPPHAGPPLHLHERADEFFRVIEGRYRFRVGDATVEAGPGHTLFVPRGAPHCFYNPCETPGKLFVGLTPGGDEAFFPAVAAAGLDPARDRDAVAALAAAHGLQLLGPNPLKPAPAG